MREFSCYWATDCDWRKVEAKFNALPQYVTTIVFPGAQYQAPRSWTERAYPKLIYHHQAQKRGHFAAWEQSTIFVQERRTAFKQPR